MVIRHLTVSLVYLAAISKTYLLIVGLLGETVRNILIPYLDQPIPGGFWPGVIHGGL
jgi:hypothetical protein